MRHQTQTAKPEGRYTSNYRGVCRKSRGIWKAYIGSGIGPGRHVGHFTTEEEAARAYDDVAYFVFGPRAKLNFPGQTKPTLVWMEEC